MDREALQTMYSVAVDEGYGGDLGEFFTLIQTNPEALDTVYMLAKKEGYKQSMATFELLLGLKKKKKLFQTYSIQNIQAQICLRIQNLLVI